MKSYLSFLILITLMMRNSAYAQIVYPSIGYDKTDEITPPEGTEITYKYLLMNVEDISLSNALDSVAAIEKIIVDTIVYDINGLVIQKKSTLSSIKYSYDSLHRKVQSVIISNNLIQENNIRYLNQLIIISSEVDDEFYSVDSLIYRDNILQASKLYDKNGLRSTSRYIYGDTCDSILTFDNKNNITLLRLRCSSNNIVKDESIIFLSDSPNTGKWTSFQDESGNPLVTLYDNDDGPIYLTRYYYSNTAELKLEKVYDFESKSLDIYYFEHVSLD